MIAEFRSSPSINRTTSVHADEHGESPNLISKIMLAVTVEQSHAITKIAACVNSREEDVIQGMAKWLESALDDLVQPNGMAIADMMEMAGLVPAHGAEEFINRMKQA